MSTLVFQSTWEISANGPSTQRILSLSLLRSPSHAVITIFRGSFYRNRLDSWKSCHHILVAMVFDMILLRAGERKKNNPLVWVFFERVWYSTDLIRLQLLSSVRHYRHTWNILRDPPFSRQQDFRIILFSRRCTALEKNGRNGELRRTKQGKGTDGATFNARFKCMFKYLSPKEWKMHMCKIATIQWIKFYVDH